MSCGAHGVIVGPDNCSVLLAADKNAALDSQRRRSADVWASRAGGDYARMTTWPLRSEGAKIRE